MCAKKRSVGFFGVIAILGNLLFIAWVTYNGLKEHFRGTLPEKVSYIGLMLLLLLNTWIIIFYRRK